LQRTDYATDDMTAMINIPLTTLPIFEVHK